MWTSSCPVPRALGAAKPPRLLFLLARQCRMLPSNRPNLPTPDLPHRLLKLQHYGPKLPDVFKVQTLRNLRNRLLELLELPAVPRRAFPFLLARNCRMLPSNPSNASNPPIPSKPALGAASCAMPSLFIFSWPATAGCSLQTFQTFQTFRNLPNRHLELPNYGLHVAGHVFPFLWPETAGCSLQTLQTLRNLPNWL